LNPFGHRIFIHASQTRDGVAERPGAGVPNHGGRGREVYAGFGRGQRIFYNLLKKTLKTSGEETKDLGRPMLAAICAGGGFGDV